MTRSPALAVGVRQETFGRALSVAYRIIGIGAAALVLIGTAAEAYRIGYQDGYRVADQVGADRPAEAAAR